MPYQVEQSAEWTDQEYQSRKHLALELAELLSQSGVLAQNPWCGAGCKPMPQSDLERLVVAIKELRSQLQDLISAGSELSTIVGLPSSSLNLVSTTEIAQLAQYVKRCPEFTDRSKLTSPRWATDLPAMEGVGFAFSTLRIGEQFRLCEKFQKSIPTTYRERVELVDKILGYQPQ